MSLDQQPPARQRYGDLDDDDDEEDDDGYMSDDVPPQQNGASHVEQPDPEAEAQRQADMAAAQALPPNVKNFITSLRSAMSNNNLAQMHNLYTSVFPKLTQEYYAQSEWPEVEVVSCLVDGNQVFAIFYKELYYRHIYSRLTPDIDDRFVSYENYCAIFNYILNSDGPINLDLPIQWLWDILDEFMWQFSSFSLWRNNLNNKHSEEDTQLLSENRQVWSCYSVLNVLYSLIQKSKILDQLKAMSKKDQQSSSEAMEEIAGEYGSKNLYRMLGLFSVITLVRVHTMLGDYTLALKVLDDVDIKRLPSRDVPAAHISLHYHIGFSYLMLHRYNDAIYHLSRGYQFFQGPKRGGKQLGSGMDAISKQADRILALLTVAFSLSQIRFQQEELREARETREMIRLNEKFNDYFEILQGKLPSTSGHGSSSQAMYEDMFRYGSPKSISPISLPLGNAEALARIEDKSLLDQSAQTLKLFINDIKPYITVTNDLRSLLKLYTSIGVDKLCKLSGTSSAGTEDGTSVNKEVKTTDELLRDLLLLKGSIKVTKWTENPNTNSLLNSEEIISGNLNFSVSGQENNTIKVIEQKRARQFTGRFLSQGLVARNVLDQIKSRPLPAPVYATSGASQAHSTTAASETQRPPIKSQVSTAPSVAASTGKTVAWAK